MRETHPNSGGKYVQGTFWKECPRCGFDYLYAEFVEDPITGTMVCPVCVDKEC